MYKKLFILIDVKKTRDIDSDLNRRCGDYCQSDCFDFLNVTAHRSYVPNTDMEALLREQKLPLCSLEAGMPLARYDVLGITLPYELCFTNILTVLDLAGLPLRARDRDEGYPLVLGGGSCAFNPEPMADFFDAILVGNAKETVVRIAEVLQTAKTEKTDQDG